MTSSAPTIELWFRDTNLGSIYYCTLLHLRVEILQATVRSSKSWPNSGVTSRNRKQYVRLNSACLVYNRHVSIFKVTLLLTPGFVHHGHKIVEQVQSIRQLAVDHDVALKIDAA